MSYRKSIKEGNYIINLESAPSCRSHWVAMRIPNKEAMHCNCFGGMLVEEAVNFVREKKGSHLAYDNSVIQDFKSNNCGYYSFCLLLFVTNDLCFFQKPVFFKLVKQEINNLLQFLAPSSAGWANGRET